MAKGKKKVGRIYFAIVAALLALVVYVDLSGKISPVSLFNGKSISSFINSTFSTKNGAALDCTLKDLTVCYFDVGQGDSVLVYCDGKTMLIDGGIPDMANRVENDLKTLHVKKLDDIIATHPHDDHIGGLVQVLKDFDYDKLIMPKTSANTKTYESFLSAVAAKNKKIMIPEPGKTFQLGGAKVQIVAPNNTYDDMNNMSVVLRLDYKGKSFLFTGDASAQSEADMIKKKYNLKADVLKVGHHGSTSATTAAFLKAVKPEYAVISVGAGNTYGHPAQATLNRLNQSGIKVLRTDLNGSVVFHYDGKNLTYKTDEGN